MSKFRVTVCLPGSAQGNPMASIATAMRPFDLGIDPETGCEGYNPQGEWDWWYMSSEENLVARPEYDGDPRLLFEPKLPGGGVRERGPLRCDGGPRGLLDLEGMRAPSAAEAAATWAVWARFSAEYPLAEPLLSFYEQHGVEPGIRSSGAEQAELEFRSQSLVETLAQYALHGGDPRYPADLSTQDPVALFACGEHEYIERRAAGAVPTFALLTLDGNWADPYDSAPLSGVLAQQSESADYWALADRYLRGLPPEVLMVQLLCHS